MFADAMEIEQAIERQKEEHPFSGVILVREKGSTVFENGYGYANRAEFLPNTIHTRFPVASGSK